MNTDLQKKRGDRRRYLKKYMERHKTLCVTLDNESDKDILEWLSAQENRSQSVRMALRGALKEDSYGKQMDK